jgi:hypothetical protein
MLAPSIPSSAKHSFFWRFCVVILLLAAVISTADVRQQVEAQQTVGPVISVSAASYERNVAPDSSVAAFVANFTTVTEVVNSPPLPNILSNITVEVNGRLAALLFISPGHSNCLLPDNAVEGTGQVVMVGEIEICAGTPSIFVANADAPRAPEAKTA